VQTFTYSTNWRTVGDRKEREQRLKDDIRRRLASICSNLTPREFDELIEKIATNQLKGELRPLRLESLGRWNAASLKIRP
jgi:hypothetical protein